MVLSGHEARRENANALFSMMIRRNPRIMALYSVLKRGRCRGSGDARGNHRRQSFKSCGVFDVEAGSARAIEINHPHERAIMDDRHDDLRRAGRIAGDMSGKGVNILDSWVSRVAAAAPHTPRPTGMRMQAGLP